MRVDESAFSVGQVARAASVVSDVPRETSAANAGITFLVRSVAVAVGVALYFGWANRTFQFDDGLIYQRYVRNVIEGNGLVYNIGERFNGLTSPFYSLLSVAAAFVTRDPQVATAVLASLAMAAGLCVHALLFARHASVVGAGMGAVLAASHAYFYYTFGVETTLFVLLVATSVLLFLERASPGWLGLSLTLLVLTRPEGALLVAPMLYEHVRQRRDRPKLVHFAAPLALLTIVLVLNTAYYGSPLPATAAAKMGQGFTGYWGRWPAFVKIAYQVEWFFGGSWLLAGAFVALVGLGAVKLGKSPLNRLVLGFLGLLTVSYLSFNAPSYHWYYAPYYAFAYFYAGTGAAWLLERTPVLVGETRVSVAGVALSAVLAAIPLASLLATWANLGRPTNPRYISAGYWLAANTPPSATIAAVEIGYIGWYSRRRIVDVLGLVNPLNAEFIKGKDLHSWLGHYQPDYILMHSPGWSLEAAAEVAEHSGRYVVDERFTEPGLKLLKRR